MQAVVKIGSSQYLVSPGDELLISRQDPSSEALSVSDVLLLIDGDDIQVGQPFVNGVSVKAKVLGEQKGEKLRISTYKAKSRLRKTIGFRAQYTKIKIEDIQTSKSPKSEAVETPKKATTKSKKTVKQVS